MCEWCATGDLPQHKFLRRDKLWHFDRGVWYLCKAAQVRIVLDMEKAKTKEM